MDDIIVIVMVSVVLCFELYVYGIGRDEGLDFVEV